MSLDRIANEIGTKAERFHLRMKKGAQRIVFAGGPRTGKTTLAETVANLFGGEVFHTDDLIGRNPNPQEDWSDASAEAARWMKATPGPWILEGVAAVRALRKWLDVNREGLPCDLVSFMSQSREPLSKGQQSMAKGCWTIWNGKPGERGVLYRLLERGVMIEED